jgi:hypothetical protein
MHRWLVYSVLIILIGCQDVVDFSENGKYKKALVIEAFITNQPDHQRVRVSYTAPFGDSVGIAVTDATVKIADTKGDTMQFQYTENGWYTNDVFVALPENNYTLLVRKDAVEYYASSIMIPMHGLDSLSYTFYKKANTTDSAYYLKIFAGPKDPDNPKYYQIQIYRNHKLFTSGNTVMLISDKAIQTLNGIELDQAFAKNDTLDVELYSLSRKMLDYYVYIFNDLLYNSNLDLDFKTNPPIQFIPNALGYFQVSALSRKSIIIR